VNGQITGLDEATEMLEINVVLVRDRFLAKTGGMSETVPAYTCQRDTTHIKVLLAALAGSSTNQTWSVSAWALLSALVFKTESCG